MSRSAFLATIVADPDARARLIRWHLRLHNARARNAARATFRSTRPGDRAQAGDAA